MNPANATIPEEPDWTASVPVAAMIQSAIYAILREEEVVLVVNQEGETLNGVTLTTTAVTEGGPISRFEQALHYDADTALSKDHAQEKLQEGDWELTRRWAAAEAHLHAG